MNAKIDRMTRDIDKTRDKISELKARLREMEKQKTDMENSEIVALFRTINVTPQELAGFIKLYREQGGGAPAMPQAMGGYDDQPEEQEEPDIEK